SAVLPSGAVCTSSPPERRICATRSRTTSESSTTSARGRRAAGAADGSRVRSRRFDWRRSPASAINNTKRPSSSVAEAPMYSAADHQRAVDTETRRDREHHARAEPELALERDGAAELFDGGAHDVEAHAAARQLGHLRRGGEPVAKEELGEIRAAERGGGARR